jgi:DNA-binding LytR/AlgR family response regulator
MTPTALIAEDEPLLAADLQAALAALWPALRVVAMVGDGDAAVERTLALRPDLLFLDIRMPGQSGLDAAQAIVEDWPEGEQPLPLIVFVTAYDQYALTAFEHAAADYVLKPVQRDRLAQTCSRLQAALAQREQAAPGHALPDAMVQQLRALIGASAPATPSAPSPLRVIQAGVGNAIHLVPVDEVLYFEAADKYVRVVTAEREHLIRTSLRELQPLLDAQRFWQIHRGTIVRCDAIASAVREESGKLGLTLRGRPEKLTVSRMYAHLFKAM